MSVSSNPSVGYMRQRNGSTFIQEMACALFGAKPLPELVLVYCRLDSWEQISVKSHYSGVIMSTMAFRITGVSIVGKSLVTGDFPAQRASNAENFPFDDASCRVGILSFSFKKMHAKLSSAKMVAILSRGRWVNINETNGSGHWNQDLFIMELMPYILQQKSYSFCDYS